MTGSATYAHSADTAALARDRLDAAAMAMAVAEDAQRSALAALVELWPTSAWIAAGATSAKRWLIAYTGCSDQDAHRLERLAGLCHRHPGLAHAVLSGLVDQERDLRRLPRHTLTMSARLFGGGEIHADLSPVAFANVATALDAWTDDPDPRDAPYQRGLGERRADTLDEQLHPDPEQDEEEVDPLLALRRRLRRAEQHRRRRARRRTRARSGICINVHVDLRTITGIRDLGDLDGLIQRGEGWNLTKQAAEQLACDATWVATLFDGPGHVLDANDAAEHWSPKQRRTIAARDRHCVFPSCSRPPRHCDIHHLDPRSRGGPTKTSNGALLCRFHHRLLHHGWHLTIHHGHWTATDPHGTTWTGRPARGDPP